MYALASMCQLYVLPRLGFLLIVVALLFGDPPICSLLDVKRNASF